MATATIDWDPLFDEVVTDPGIVNAAKKRELQNILKSYTGYYDLFAEMIQNALDAVEKRKLQDGQTYAPQIVIKINLKPNENEITVIDNGCGMNEEEFKTFLRPNYSFKDADAARGSKGVGATYLAFAFNHLIIATKQSSGTLTGIMANGRKWLDDSKNKLTSPKVCPHSIEDPDFKSFDNGTLVSIKLVGDNIRPKDLAWLGATTAEQWMALLRVHTPAGGVYLAGHIAPKVKITLHVNDDKGVSTTTTIDAPRYLYPHDVLGKSGDLREFLKDQEQRAAKQLDTIKVPAKFQKLNGIWGEWSGEQIVDGKSPIKPRLDASEAEQIRALGLRIYVFLGFSTDLWDSYNDTVLKLRKSSRLLRGGLQLATRHMPQGHMITIPLTETIGFQTITHILIHFANTEPDLGRKGFQPEHTRLAERLSVSAVTAFKRYYGRLLKSKTGAPTLLKAMKLDQWIDTQKDYEKKFPLVIRGKGLFAPTEELPIRSEPQSEQDVVALFNQMLSSGIVRGIQLLASSQSNQYDGLYRIRMSPPFDKFIRSDENPLGVDAEVFANMTDTVESPVRVLEYKHNLDALIEEFSTSEKVPNDIGLAVVWELGEKWKEQFTILSYLDEQNLHHRQFHGVTHSLSFPMQAQSAFEVIALHDLVKYLLNRDKESHRQAELYGAE